jgi:methyl-accepting chemotaxis protein
MFFLEQCVALAEQEGNRSEAVRCRSLLGLRCSNIGMYDEALLILDSIQTAGADKETLGAYYEAYNNVYSELAYYTHMEAMRKTYQQKAQHYEELMYQYLPPDAETRFLRLEQKAQAEGNLKESMRINDEWLKTVEKGSHPYALVALYRYIEFKERRDSTQMMEWLVESVLADIRNSVMDQGSMWELANELMLNGDFERASRYIIFTSECANRYGSRQRNWQISPLLSDIAKGYKGKSEKTTRQLRWLLGVTSVLALALLAAFFYVRSRNRQLRAARNALSSKNRELSELNVQLSEANQQQSVLNGQLKTLNDELAQSNNQLSESNRVKEEYIGRFLRLCSMYIDQMDSLRKRVNKLMKNRQFEELSKITRPQEFRDKELEELYVNFDSAFLHLFPNFVNDFNALLRPEERIEQPDDGRLPTAVRIFALIRLGIDDSGKIAEFLHYSVNTIYNYRARVKNGALRDRENFEKHVKEIGMPRR